MSEPNTAETRLMLKLEQGLHRNGWDQPPALYAILRDPTAGHLRLKEQPVPWDMHPNPAVILEGVGAQVAQGTEYGEMLSRMLALNPGFFGLLFAHEAWSNTEVAPATMREKSLADIVGSRELRLVFTFTVEAKAYIVTRHRGEKPRVDEFDQIAGRIPEALARIVQGAARHMPDEAVDREALDTIKILTEVEIDEAYLKAQQNRAAEA